MVCTMRPLVALAALWPVACVEGSAPSGTWALREGAQEPVRAESESSWEPVEQEPVERALPLVSLEARADDYADVLVIGSGAAGLAAGIAAREAGASVIILERASKAGTGITYATRALAVATSFQEAAGVSDTVEKAVEDWPALTGVSGEEPAVYDFLEGSAATLAWAVEKGFAYNGLASDPDSGSPARLHQVRGEDTRRGMIASFDGELRLRVEVDALLVRDGRVAGARWTDLDTGETGATGAGAVVVATGGFLRDRARVDAARPALAGRTLLWETSPHADGGGVGMLEAVGAAFSSLENIGLYVHAIQDPELAEGEALILGAMDQALLVDSTGQRFANEAAARSLDFFDALPEDQIFAVLPDELAGRYTAGRPDYNWTDPDVPEGFSLGELAAISEDVLVGATPSDLAELAGIDPETLGATIEEAHALALAGETDAFGRDFGASSTFEADLWWAVRFTPGLAKAFGGVSTDVEARVLDAMAEPIPGLYAAGEVAGMLPQGGAGTGFSGSIMACYHYGRLAGQNAAAEASAR